MLRASVAMDEDILAALQGESAGSGSSGAGAGAGSAGAGDYTGPGSSSAVGKRIAAAKAAWDKSHQAKLAELEGSLRAKFDEESAELRGREKGARKELDRLRAQLADVRKELAAAQKASSELMTVRYGRQSEEQAAAASPYRRSRSCRDSLKLLSCRPPRDCASYLLPPSLSLPCSARRRRNLATQRSGPPLKPACRSWRRLSAACATSWQSGMKSTAACWTSACPWRLS